MASLTIFPEVVKGWRTLTEHGLGLNGSMVTLPEGHFVSDGMATGGELSHVGPE